MPLTPDQSAAINEAFRRERLKPGTYSTTQIQALRDLRRQGTSEDTFSLKQASYHAMENLYDKGFDTFMGRAKMLVDHLPAVMASAVALPVGVAVSAGAGPAIGGSFAVPAAVAGGVMGKELQAKLRGKPASDAEVVGEGLKQGVFEAAGNLAGSVAGKALTSLGRVFGGRVVPHAAESIEIMRDMNRGAEDYLIEKGFDSRVAKAVTKDAFFPAEISSGRVLDFVDNFVRGSGLFGAKRQEFEAARETLMDGIADGFIKSVGTKMSPAELADTIGKTILSSKARRMAPISKAHDAIAQRLRTVTTGGRRVVAETGSEVGLVDVGAIKYGNNLKALRQFNDEIPAGTFAREGSDKLLQDIMNLPDQASFDAIKRLRTRLGERVYRPGPIVGAPKEFKAAGKELYGQLTDAMGKALSDFDKAMAARNPAHEAIKPMWDAANEATAEVYSQFDRAFLNKLVRFHEESLDVRPSTLLKDLIAKDGEEVLTSLKDIVGESSPAWQGLRRLAVADLFEKSSDQEGRLVGTKLLKQLSDRPGVLGKAQVDIVLGPAKTEELTKFARAIALAQDINTAPGSRVAQWQEGRLVLNAYTRPGLAKEATTFAITVSGLRAIAQSPKLTQALVDTLRFKQVSRTGSALAMKIIASLGKDQIEMLGGEQGTLTLDEIRNINRPKASPFRQANP